MPYIGQEPLTGQYIILDDISSSFDGSTVTFNLTNGTEPVYPQTEQNLIVSISGIYQYPRDAYMISSN